MKTGNCAVIDQCVMLKFVKQNNIFLRYFSLTIPFVSALKPVHSYNSTVDLVSDETKKPSMFSYKFSNCYQL